MRDPDDAVMPSAAPPGSPNAAAPPASEAFQPRLVTRRWSVVLTASLAVATFVSAVVSLPATGALPMLAWPPVGIALAALVLLGASSWPAVLAGVLGAAMVRHLPLVEGVSLAVGTTVEAVAGRAVLRGIAGFRPTLDRIRDAAGLALGAAVLVPAIGALTVLVPMLARGGATSATLTDAWCTRWIMDGLGVLMFAPILLVVLRPPFVRPSRSKALQGLACSLALLALGNIVFRHHSQIVLPYLVYPVLMGIALRFGSRSGLLAALTISTIAWISSVQGAGPFSSLGQAPTLLALQVFVAATITTALLLGAARRERDEALESVRETRDGLEDRVRQRTEQLVRLNRELGRQIDERRRAEEMARSREQALRSSEERFRAVADTANDAILTANDQGKLCYVNRAALRLLGGSVESLIGRSFTSLLPTDTREASRERIRRQLLGPRRWAPTEPIEATVRRQDGREVPVELSVARWRTPGDGLYYTGIVRDLTERKREEERLRRSEERFRLLVDGVRDLAIFALDTSGRVTSWNVGAERLTGFRQQEVLGTHFSRFFTEDDVASGRPDALLRMAAMAGRFEDEGWRERRDGGRFWANVILSALHDDAGNLIGYAKVVRDLTERKESDEALRRAHEGLESRIRERTSDLSHANAELKRQIVERREVERALERHARELAHSNAELELFGYVASHDLREPLRTVTSYTQLLARRYRGTLGSDADQFIQYAVDAATWMHRLLDDLLAYSRLGRTQLNVEPVAGDRLLEGALTNLRLAIQESGAVVTHDALPELTGDAPQLVQLLQNLIGNGIKFRGQEPPRIHVSAKRIGNHFRFSVRDNGIGMDPKHLDRIFVAFQRLHTREEYAGTGVGLAICKKIVERHRGRIWARSTPGEGSEFLFTLPVTIPVSREPAPAPRRRSTLARTRARADEPSNTSR